MKLNIRFRLAGYEDVTQIADLIVETERESADEVYVAGGDKKFG